MAKDNKTKPKKDSEIKCAKVGRPKKSVTGSGASEKAEILALLAQLIKRLDKGISTPKKAKASKTEGKKGSPMKSQ